VSAQVAMLPKNYVSLEGKAAQSMLKLLDLIEDHDDVQHVWSNMDVDEKELEAFA
jgi:transcriptional/translational regulatory protein YebC/TACO1